MALDYSAGPPETVTFKGAITPAAPCVYRRPSVSFNAVLPDATLLEHIANYGDISFEQYIVNFVGRFTDVGSSNIGARLNGSHYFLSVIKATFDNSRAVILTSYSMPARRFVNTVTSGNVWASANWTELASGQDVGIAQVSPTGTNATRYIKIASYPAPTTTSSQAVQIDLRINARMNSAASASTYLLSFGLVRAALPYTVTAGARRLDLNAFVAVEFGYVRNDTAGTFDVYAKTTQNYPNLIVSKFTLNGHARDITLFPGAAAWEAAVPADGDNAYTVIPQLSVLTSDPANNAVVRLPYIGSTTTLPQATLRDYILAQGNVSFEQTIMNFPTKFSDLANLTALQPAMNTYCHLKVQRVSADNAFMATVIEGGNVANPRMFYRTAGGSTWQDTGWSQIATDRQGVFVPAPPATGTVTLQSVNGVLAWV